MSHPPPSSALLGERISLRLHDADGGFRDIVGILESETSVRKRNGEIVDFSPSDIAAWRKVESVTHQAGKGAPTSVRIKEMEMAAAQTWPAAHQKQMGEWTLRATGKFTMRANSVLALGEPGLDLDVALDQVMDFYRAHELPAVIHIPLPTFQNLDDDLAMRGWSLKTEALVMVTDIEPTMMITKPDFSWSISSDVSAEWLGLQNDDGVSGIMKSAPALYAMLREGSTVIAVGRAANAGDWTVLTRLFVHPDYRRKQIGTELISYLLQAAAIDGATKALLQVDVNNHAAISAYEKYGFRKHHSYRYRIAPPHQNTSTTGC